MLLSISTIAFWQVGILAKEGELRDCFSLVTKSKQPIFPTVLPTQEILLSFLLLGNSVAYTQKIEISFTVGSFFGPFKLTLRLIKKRNTNLW